MENFVQSLDFNAFRYACKCDWASFTLKGDLIFSMNIFEKYFNDWKSGAGRNGYKSAFYADGITVLFDGRSDMGVHIDISGTGCDLLYSQNFNILEWLGDQVYSLIVGSCNITRLDISLDYFHNSSSEAPSFPYRELIDCLVSGSFVSRVHKSANSIKVYNSIDFKGVCADPSATCYIGSPKSDILLRIYNKMAEQLLSKGNDLPVVFDNGSIDQWIRFEFQLRHFKAMSFMSLLRNYYLDVYSAGAGSDDVLFYCFMGVLNSYIRFVDINSCPSNISLCCTLPWWEKFTMFTPYKLCEHRGSIELKKESVYLAAKHYRHALYAFSVLFGWDALIDIITDDSDKLPLKYKIMVDKAINGDTTCSGRLKSVLKSLEGKS